MNASKRTIVVCGYGTGISDAVARKFGAEGFAIALVARNAERLAAAEQSLTQAGITAKAFPCELGSPDAVRALIRDARAALGPVAVVHWNAYAGGAGDLLTGNIDELRGAIDVSLLGMIAATQEALPDLRSEHGALLVTGGGLAFYDPNVDKMAVSWGAMGLAVAKAAQHKAVGLLHQRLASEGVYVGEVVVLGSVKGTAFDSGHATLEPATVANRFWELFQGRSEASVTVS